MCLPLGDQIAQRQQTVRKMNGFNHNIIWGCDLIIGEIPNPPHPSSRKPVSHILCGSNGNGQHPNADRVLLQKLFQLIGLLYRNSCDGRTYNGFPDVKSGQQLKSVSGKTKIFDNSTAQVTGSKHH